MAVQESSRRSFLRASLFALPALAAAGKAGRVPGREDVKLGVITDEISQDLEEALSFLAEYKLRYCELRQVWGKNLMNLIGAEVERVRTLLRKYDMRVSNLASPIYKYDLPEMPAPKSEARDTFQAEFTDADTESLLKRAFQIARVLGTNVIRIFSYWRVEDPKKAGPFVRERLARGAALAAEHNMILALENEHTCNVGTGEELGRMVRDVGSPHLRAVWDPGNAALLGETPYPEGYAAVRGLLAHLHVKDLKLDREAAKFVWVPVGEGLIDYRGQFKSLFEDGYAGTISLETHYRRADGNVKESTREALVGLLKVLEEAA